MSAAAVADDAASTAVIRTRGLTKRYGTKLAVDHLDLELQPGEVFGLLGPNGAGKTTTILMLLGLTEPSEGTAEVVGLDPARNPLEVKRHVGYLPDNVGFYGPMTARENLRYTARLNGLRGRAIDERLDPLLEQVGLTYAADQRVDQFSRGMRQRLGIADALVKQPSVVILDEPTIAIDPEGITEILGLIRTLAEEEGVAVLLSSHQLHQVESICDRVGIFVNGRMVAEGAMSALAQQLAASLSSIEVTVEGDASRVESALQAVPGVSGVTRHDRNPQTWVVTAEGDIRGPVTRALVDADLIILGLRRRGEALDEIYRRWFEQPDAPEVDAPVEEVASDGS